MSRLSKEQVEQFNRDGFLMVEGLFDAEEMELLIRIAKADQQLAEKAIERRDLSGDRSKLWITDSLGEDIYSAFVHCRRIVDPSAGRASERKSGGFAGHSRRSLGGHRQSASGRARPAYFMGSKK